MKNRNGGRFFIDRIHGERISVFSNIRHIGNTSSSSLPIGLAGLLPERRAGEDLGLCAFGGGFTFGGAILQMR